MLLKTERLTIRHIISDDWKSIKEIWVDFNGSEYAQYDMPHITDDADVQARIARWAAANRGTEHMFFAICLGEIVIGYIAFNIRENGYEIGYCFHSAYHGKGYAKESHIALFDYLRTLGITKFSAGTALNNTPSVKLLTSLGFQLMGQEKVSFYKDAEGNDIVFDGGIFEVEHPGYIIIPYDEKHRDDMIFMVLEAKDALGRAPRLNEDLLDVQKNYIDSGDMFWLAIDEHDRVIGCIGYNSIPGTTEVKLHRLYIKAARKRQGIGTCLLHTVELHLQDQGKTAVHVHLGGKEYFESRSFYPKHGYKEYAPSMMKKEL